MNRKEQEGGCVLALNKVHASNWQAQPLLNSKYSHLNSIGSTISQQFACTV